MRRVILLGFALSGVAILANCVGSDPATEATAPVEAGASVDATDDAPMYGAFLTSRLYGTDFAAGQTVDTVRAFADQQCSDAARDAGLAAPELYSAAIAALPSGQSAAELGSLGFLKTTTGRWCNVTSTAGTPQVSCAGTGVIFASPDSLKQGPDNSLTNDEHGVPITTEVGLFLSGLVLDGGANIFAGAVQNCTSWSLLRTMTGSDDAGSIKAGIGSVRQVAYPAGATYAWVAGEPERECVGTYKLPLLCLQHPALP